MTRASDTARALSGGATFNEGGADVDFRVESDDNANMLVVNAGDDIVGIGTATQGRETNLAVVGTDQLPTGAWSQFGIYSNDSYAINKGGSMMFGGQDGSVARQLFSAIKGAKENSTSGNYAGYLAFYTRPVGDTPIEAIRIHSNQVVSASAGVALGVGTANTASNVLDDYEEGTWTPSIGGDATYTSQDGVYTKIGNMVHLQCKFQVNVIGTGSTNVLSGLPFASNNSWTSGSLSVEYYASIATSMVWVSGYVANNASNISFSGNSASATTIGHNGFAIFGNSARVDFQCSYRTA